MGVESAPGEGSTFRFDLPVARAAAVAAPERVAGEDSTSILVVDDEPVIRQVLVNQLAPEGYAITQAASGPEALKRIEERPCDLVLLDVMMPRMSGYEVCRALRERHPLDELPVIFLTAKNQAEDLVVGLAAGANDYLPKPISKSELLARIKTHLGLLRVNRQLSGLVAERTAQVEERERLLAERERLIGELEARNAELARFNYTVSHDLKNPLVTIKNFLGVLRRDT
ncbi:MAG: response regulator, partial [bacterium]|nr:response regulator [bacterium]